MKIRHKAGYLEVIDPKFPEIIERGKVMEAGLVEPFGSEPGIAAPHANPKSLDEWVEVKLVHFFERPGPPVLFVRRGQGIVVCGEGVVKMREGSDVPWATSQRARQKSAFVVKKVGYYLICEFLRQLGDQ